MTQTRYYGDLDEDPSVDPAGQIQFFADMDGDGFGDACTTIVQTGLGPHAGLAYVPDPPN